MRQGRHEALNRGLVLAVAAGVVLATTYAGVRAMRARRGHSRPVFDYSDRSGFPKPPEQMRGIARQSPAAQRAPVTV
jgi:hypothetical protein